MKDKLYNGNLKMEYLNNQDIDESTKSIMVYEFGNTAILEKQYGKDVYAFNDLEIEEFLKSLRSSNVISLRKTLSILNSYTKWCIENGKRGKYENNINNINAFIKTETNLSKYVSNKQLSSKILAKEELDDLLNILINPVDQAIVLSMYEFINGERLHELRNLKEGDIDFVNNTVALTDLDGTTRRQSISKKLTKILAEVISTETYIYNNGLADDRGNIPEREFAMSKHIIKPSKTINNKDLIMTYSSLLNRIRKIRLFTGYNHVTSNSLKETRIIHEIIDIMKLKNLYKPNNIVYEEVIATIYKLYNVEISSMQIYSIKQKVEQLLSIKKF